MIYLFIYLPGTKYRTKNQQRFNHNPQEAYSPMGKTQMKEDNTHEVTASVGRDEDKVLGGWDF